MGLAILGGIPRCGGVFGDNRARLASCSLGTCCANDVVPVSRGCQHCLASTSLRHGHSLASVVAPCGEHLSRGTPGVARGVGSDADPLICKIAVAQNRVVALRRDSSVAVQAHNSCRERDQQQVFLRQPQPRQLGPVAQWLGAPALCSDQARVDDVRATSGPWAMWSARQFCLAIHWPGMAQAGGTFAPPSTCDPGRTGAASRRRVRQIIWRPHSHTLQVGRETCSGLQASGGRRVEPRLTEVGRIGIAWRGALAGAVCASRHARSYTR